MNYTVSAITTKDDCKAIIELKELERQELVTSKKRLDIDRQRSELDSPEIEGDILTVSAEISAFQTLYNSLADGPQKRAVLVSLQKFEAKRTLFQKRKESTGGMALVEREHDVTRLDSQIIDIDEYVTQLTARMHDLP